MGVQIPRPAPFDSPACSGLAHGLRPLPANTFREANGGLSERSESKGLRLRVASLESVNLIPSEGAKPPEEERVATLVSAEGPTSYRLVGVAPSDPAVGFKSLARH